ncbi:MAG: hypothetical protein ACYS0E_14885, partial [Planctomycetota bacterium]
MSPLISVSCMPCAMSTSPAKRSRSNAVIVALIGPQSVVPRICADVERQRRQEDQAGAAPEIVAQGHAPAHRRVRCIDERERGVAGAAQRAGEPKSQDDVFVQRDAIRRIVREGDLAVDRRVVEIELVGVGVCTDRRQRHVVGQDALDLR